MKNNYNFGVVKFHLKFNHRTESTPHKFQTHFPSQNLILFQPEELVVSMKEILEIEFLDIEENSEYYNIIENVLKECMVEENLQDKNYYVSIILTTPDQIQKMNNEFRKVNKATDVLSFPMFEKDEIYNKPEEIRETLGDIVISIDKVKEQAKEYEHSFERELSYMVVHGFYHLMGYDHIEQEERKEMRLKEENILGKLNILR